MGVGGNGSSGCFSSGSGTCPLPHREHVPSHRGKTAEERYNHWSSQVIRRISLKHHHLEKKSAMMNWCAHVLLASWLLLQRPYRLFSRLLSWSLVDLNRWNSAEKVGIVRPSPSPVIIPSFHHPQLTRLATMQRSLVGGKNFGLHFPGKKHKIHPHPFSVDGQFRDVARLRS